MDSGYTFASLFRLVDGRPNRPLTTATAMKLPFTIFLFCPFLLFSQTGITEGENTLGLNSTIGAIKLDGFIDEADWQNAPVATGFIRTFPVDTGLASTQTEVRMLFDDKFLYISAVCRQAKKSYTITSLKRDFPIGTSDEFNVLIDPFKDGLNGFLFGVNPLNVQHEALIDNGTTLSFEWDNKWYSAVHNGEDTWTVEMAIPFKTLRYKRNEGDNQWRMNFIRSRMQNWEVSTWQPIPRQFNTHNLAFAGRIDWVKPPPKPGANVTLIPYVTGSGNIIYAPDPVSQKREGTSDFDAGFGGDAKIGITPSLNLDLTFNPDFSQVEVDRQVANLSRFELFFPERRQFFLENRDLFAMFGFPDSRPFFSRRIGLADTSADRSNRYAQVPILAGARLSGKLTDKLRMGLLSMQTAKLDLSGNRSLPAANFTVATLQHKVFDRSAISGILVNKQNFLDGLTDTEKANYEPWNRVAGLEYNLYSADNRWEGEWYYHRSFSPDEKQRGQTLASFLGYNDRHLNANLGYMMVDSFYSAEAGFVPRIGVQNFYPGVGFTFYPDHKYLNTWSTGVEGGVSASLEFQETDRDLSLYVDATLKDQSGLTLLAYNTYTYLFEPFNPSNVDEPGVLPLPGMEGYTYSGFGANLYTSPSYDVQGNLEMRVGQYFNGTWFRADGELNFRWQPVGTLGISYSYTDIRLPDPYASTSFWILGPRAELSFSRNVFFSAFLQYNTQFNNINVNTRLQWRFAPVSDVFLVYTDNSFAETIPGADVRLGTPKNKALVLKVVYWLNL